MVAHFDEIDAGGEALVAHTTAFYVEDAYRAVVTAFHHDGAVHTFDGDLLHCKFVDSGRIATIAAHIAVAFKMSGAVGDAVAIGECWSGGSRDDQFA